MQLAAGKITELKSGLEFNRVAGYFATSLCCLLVKLPNFHHLFNSTFLFLKNGMINTEQHVVI